MDSHFLAPLLPTGFASLRDLALMKLKSFVSEGITGQAPDKILIL